MQNDCSHDDDLADYGKLIVSFRGKKTEMTLSKGLTVAGVKEKSIQNSLGSPEMGILTYQDVKLLHKGKAVMDNKLYMHELLVAPKQGGAIKTKSTKPKVYRLMLTGISASEAQANNEELTLGLAKNAPRVRDDLSTAGKQQIARRRQLGRKMMHQQAAIANRKGGGRICGFGKIETLPMLPDEEKVRAILTSLANDPGILACMAKHNWNVGSLAELYPEGKVGESSVCVMGLNKNKGEQILLRVRTDDLKGFRKILSIRKVLYHELAHNVHSEHDGNFFQLMRQIEQECNELDWTQGQGLAPHVDGYPSTVTGGTYRLGGGNLSQGHASPARELAARAAMLRLTTEEEEIYQNCGCGQREDRNEEKQEQSITTLKDTEEDGNMRK
mmetsp:Transcript_22456/g.34629  ORF Transcript_22456/g.34629 Transcript_22456/m.34629 type:complete len:386 (+) Transcript_22456:95-1252(+)